MKKQNENATCIICGEKYHLCIACERNKGTWKPWKMITDSENCYGIYQVVNDYNFKKITKEEARIQLGKLDLSKSYTFKDNVKKVISEIMKKKKKVEKPVEIVETVEIVEADTVKVEAVETVEIV